MADANHNLHAAQPEPQLRALVDRNEVADLIARLGLWLDEKRFDEDLSLFTEGVAVQSPGGVAEGIERVAEQARRNHAEFEQTQHVLTNVLVELDGDHATARANLIATLVHRAGEPEPYSSLGGRYRFDAVRTPQGWRLSQVLISQLWRSGLGVGGSPAQATSSAGPQ